LLANNDKEECANMDGLRIMVDKKGKLLSRYWYARFTRAGEKRNVRIAPKIEIKGAPPTDANGHIDLKRKGDAAFEKSRKAALAALAKMRKAAKTSGKTKAVKDAETADLVNRYHQARTGKAIESTRLDALWDLWQGLERNYKPTAERMQAAKRTFEKFAEFAGEYCRTNGGKCETLDEITKEIAASWFSALREEYAWGTVRPMWHLMRTSWTRWHIYASTNPFGSVVVRNREASAEKIERRPLSEAELGRLFDVTRENPALHALVVTAACTGMRIGDVCRLKWADIDLRSGLIEATTAKAGVTVTVPIFPQLREVLEELNAKHAVGDSPFVFPWAAAQYDHVNDKGLHDKQTGIIRMVKPYFARAIFPNPEPAPAILADVKPKSIAEVLAEIDHARFSEGKRVRVREVYSRWRNGEKCSAIAAALNIARGQVSDYLKEAERVTGETYRPRINHKRARGKPTARDLMEITRTPRTIGKYSASIFGWHNLRHSFVVLALQNGVPVNDVSRIVGHGDAATTLNNYGNNSKKVVAERTRRQMRDTVLATGKAAPLIEGKTIETPGNKAPAQLPAPTKSAAERLRELKALADEGLITQAEYDTKRTAIVESL
jgi:integrase